MQNFLAKLFTVVFRKAPKAHRFLITTSPDASIPEILKEVKGRQVEISSDSESESEMELE